MTPSVSTTALRPTEVFSGKRILLSGTTGFVGKVILSMLLSRYPGVGRVYALIRPGVRERAVDRFNKTVAHSPALQPLLERYGAQLPEFLAEKVHPIDGNIVHPDCGLAAADVERLAADGVDLIINSAGLVDFDPAVDAALSINAVGTENVVALARRLDAALLHVSTCFVAGKRNGQILEDEPIINQIPVADEGIKAEFDFRREIGQLAELAQHVRSQANHDDALKAAWHAESRARLLAEGRDPDDDKALRVAMVRQRKLWLANELKRVGMERAHRWGYTNTYTFTKALGEQVIAAAVQEQGLRACIVRPAIVESSLEFPHPGWNEGFTTTAPLILLCRDGLPHFPYAENLVLDVVPCDTVASLILAAGAACLTNTHKLVYHASTGDTNPLSIRQAVELTAFSGRQRARARRDKGLKAAWLRYRETQPRDHKLFARTSIPVYRAAAAVVVRTIDKVGPERLGWARHAALSVRQVAAQIEEKSARVLKILDLFMPFVAENKYVFRADNARQLMARLPDAEQALLHYKPNAFVWRDYWLKVHIPGLEKWVLPTLTDELANKPASVYMHRDLLELFDTATHKFRHRMAFHYLSAQGVAEHLTYGQWRTLARRVASALLAGGLKPEERVLLLCESRPEWAAAFFGVLLAGGVAVPVEGSAEATQLAAVAAAAGATRVVATPAQQRRLGLDAGAPSDMWRGLTVCCLEEALNGEAELARAQEPASLAAILFPSEAAGAEVASVSPVGALWTHRNFTFQVSRLAAACRLDEQDHVLSMLPLHHGFALTAGLLLPLSRGARVTYLADTGSAMLSRALTHGITAMVGTPAAWRFLQQRISAACGQGAGARQRWLRAAQGVNAFLRDAVGINAGPLLAYPVHRGLGGRLKQLVSCEAPLSAPLQNFFRALGFNVTQVYGAGAATPALAVRGSKEKWPLGSVGRALDGVEVRIEAPGKDGVGAILARGPSIMKGFCGGDGGAGGGLVEASLENGWLRTGDCGHLDAHGRLFVVGRQERGSRRMESSVAVAGVRAKAGPEAPAVALPRAVSVLGKRLVGWGQESFYRHVMDVEVRGQHHVPPQSPFLIAANHASHLDAGLVKAALGSSGRDMCALAAKDYFFASTWRRAWFENFTNLLPIERQGAAKGSLRRAVEALEQGRSLLIFPEGTRSVDGQMRPFKPSIGYLALNSKKPVVPIYLWGTYEAMPKGATLLPMARRIGAVVGPMITYDMLQAYVAERPRNHAYRLATLVYQCAVAALRDAGEYDPADLVQQAQRVLHVELQSQVKEKIS